MKVALVQMASGTDKKVNLDKSVKLFNEAIKSKPDMIIFPEYQMVSPDYSDPEGLKTISEPLDGDFVTTFMGLSKKNSVYTLLNVSEKNYGTLRPFNTSVLIDDLGMITGKYRKLHLFDAYSKLESSLYEIGRLNPGPTTVRSVNFGLQICYDLRFPEPARLLKLLGVQVLSYQAGWYSGERKLETWKTLLRARAIENGIFVLGTAQCGKDFTGHSMVVSPYGDVLAETQNDEDVMSCDLDINIIGKYAEDVPMMKQRRKDMYDVSGL